MALAFDINIDVRPLENAAVQMADAGSKVSRAVANALNRSGDSASSVVIKDASKKLNIKQKDFTKYTYKRRAKPDLLRFILDAKSPHFKLGYFDPRQTPAGASVDPYGQRRVIPGSFVATMHSGHVGVYSREKGISNRGRNLYTRRVNAAGRVYYSQTKGLVEKYGPSPAKELTKGGRDEMFRKKADEVFVVRLKHELDRMMSGINPQKSSARALMPETYSAPSDEE